MRTRLQEATKMVEVFRHLVEYKRVQWDYGGRGMGIEEVVVVKVVVVEVVVEEEEEEEEET